MDNNNNIALFTLLINYLLLFVNCQSSYSSNYGSGNQQPFTNNYNTRSNAWQGYRSYFDQPAQQQQYSSFFQQPTSQQHLLQARQTTSNNNEPIVAVAKLQGKNVDGIVEFKQMPNQMIVFISGKITGLTPGLHGFHIHQYGDIRQNCTSMAGHFNPDNQNHGAPNDLQRHIGDLGNIEANQMGVAEFMNVIDQRISLYGQYSILGRGVVIHANQDDLGRGGHQDSLKTGNAGGRVACGIVALAAK